MTKNQIHTAMLNRLVQINPADRFAPLGPQARYLERAGQQATIVNVYLKDGDPAYDLLFADGTIEAGMYDFGFTVVSGRRDSMSNTI